MKACCGFGHRNVVLVYIIRDYGGAFDAMKYALKRKKYVIKV